MNREQVYQRVVELIRDEKGEDFQVQLNLLWQIILQQIQ